MENFLIPVLAVIFLFPIAWKDARHYSIPDYLSITGIIIIFVAQLWLGADIKNLILAAALSGGFFLLQYLVLGKDWLGSGDIILGILLGIILGFPIVFIAIAGAYISGAVAALILLLLGKKQLTSQLPLGTFLSIATIITLFLK